MLTQEVQRALINVIKPFKDIKLQESHCTNRKSYTEKKTKKFVKENRKRYFYISYKLNSNVTFSSTVIDALCSVFGCFDFLFTINTFKRLILNLRGRQIEIFVIIFYFLQVPGLHFQSLLNLICNMALRLISPKTRI